LITNCSYFDFNEDIFFVSLKFPPYLLFSFFFFFFGELNLNEFENLAFAIQALVLPGGLGSLPSLAGHLFPAAQVSIQDLKNKFKIQ